jgi:sugar lactone lactonase YvrE
MSNVYVADSGNHRIMRWSKGSTEGQIILGGNGKGHKSNQFSGVDGLSFDRQGNIYVVDWDNHRVQKFEIDSS